jgi:hypothetical protein
MYQATDFHMIYLSLQETGPYSSVLFMVSKTSTTMNNYKYADHQGPVAEWEEFVQSAGIPPPPALHLPILEMRAQTNAGRTAIAQAQVRTEGLLFPSPSAKSDA